MRTPSAVAFAAALLLVAAPASAQDRSQPVLIDAVIATVNDSAILLSTIRSEADGEIQAAQVRARRPLQQAEILAFLARALDREVNRHALAQSAKSFGVASPDQVEKIVADEMKRDEAEQVRDFGTWQKYTAELQRQGRTWQTYWREQRVEKLHQLARLFAIDMRMQKQRNLFLTPRMLRETYRRNLDLFVHGAEARLAILLVQGPGARAKAERIAAAWSLRDASARQIAADQEGVTALPPLSGIDERSRESLADAVVDFALAGPVGNVSPPIPTENGFHVVKVIGYRPAQNGRFGDRDVQLQLRLMCLDAVIGEFTKQALERAADRTEVWKTPELR